MKNVLILFGSPREYGYTRQMVEYLKKDLDNFNFVEFNAYKERIESCIACDICKTVRKCHFSDFEKIDYFFRELDPDILIIATPIYNFGFPAPLKAIFDRLQPYYNNPLEKYVSKTAILFLSSGRNLCDFEKNKKNLNIILKNIGFKIGDCCACEKTDVSKTALSEHTINCIKNIKKSYFNQ